MNPVLLSGAITVFASALYIYSRKKIQNKNLAFDKVFPVDAGAEENFDVNQHYGKDIGLILKLKSGKTVHSSDYIRIKVFGCNLTPRGILNGEEWLVKPFFNDTDTDTLIKGDVVLLYIPDKHIYKIRVFDRLENESVYTYSYKNGSRHESSRPHKMDMIRGIVKYSIN